MEIKDWYDVGYPIFPKNMQVRLKMHPKCVGTVVWMEEYEACIQWSWGTSLFNIWPWANLERI